MASSLFRPRRSLAASGGVFSFPVGCNQFRQKQNTEAMNNDQNAWQLRGTTAQLTTEFLDATLDVRRPDLGLSAIAARVNGHNVQLDTASILAVGAGRSDSEAVESTDYYVRGDDLIVSCRRTAAPQVGLQIYWRVVREAALQTNGIEAIVSAQTELLDSDPASTVSSRLPAGDVLTVAADGDPAFQPLAVADGESANGGGAVLIRLKGRPISFLEMVHPSDDRGATITRTDEQLATSYPVLTERLEKGVIRRSRLRALFLPRENDSAVAAELYRRFATSPAPLTT